jgi:hypothetical protein
MGLKFEIRENKIMANSKPAKKSTKLGGKKLEKKVNLTFVAPPHR